MLNHKEDRVDQILSFLKEKYGVIIKKFGSWEKKKSRFKLKKTDLAEEEIENIPLKTTK